MPVYKIQEEMPYTEFLKWISFFKSRPVGWREDQRTYMLLAAQGVKEKPEKLFPSLQAIQDHIPAEVKSLPKGNFLSKMLNAKDGDVSDWTPPWMSKNDKNKLKTD